MDVGPVFIKDILGRLNIQCLDYELTTLIRCENYFLDKVFYDVGCYLGLWSVAAFCRGARYIIGFDPYPTEDIIRNLANFGPRYRIMNCIVTNDKGLGITDGAFRTTLDKFYRITRFVTFEKEGHYTEDQNKKDDLLGPGFIKIDVEGSEIDVLKGGETMINKFKPHIMVESHDYMEEGRKEEVMDIFDSWDYGRPEFVTNIEDGHIHHIFYKSPL